MVKQAVHHGDLVGALDRMREQAGGLVDRDEVGVLEEDLERKLGRAGGRFLGGGQGDLHVVAGL